VTGQLFISLLNPGIGLLLAAAFFLLWLNRRDQFYVLIAAVSYVFAMLGFLLQDVGPPLPFSLQRILSNLFFLLAGSTLSAAVLRHYRVAVPYVVMAIVVAGAMIGHMWFLMVQPNLAARIYFVSFALGIVALLVVLKLYPVEKPHLVDRLLFVIAALAAVNFIVRPLAIAWLVGGYNSYEGFQQSVYWTTVQFTQAMISIMVALNLMVAIAIDLMDELRMKANTDQLSGLLNRRGFEEKAMPLLQQSAARGWPVALLIADIDHFKSINDTYGHAVGDRVIATFGELVRQAAQGGSVAGRIGGEEFAVLLPDAELGAARNYAEHIREAFPSYCAGRLPPDLSPTISIGVHAGHARMALHELLANADAALYDAKRSGRNCVSVFGPELMVVADSIAQR